MKNYKSHALAFGITAAVLLVALGIITWKWMALRKAVAVTATKTANPTSAAINAAVSAVQTSAATQV